ncbi:MAG TPA: DUF6325 family protein [Solirubrobacteraceae bacterium]|nr:DUF6325 family protein [Solirubrobacteraceae bacterium]
MGEEQLEEMGPVDYIVIEWPGRQPTGEVVPMIVEAAERGIIRILDVAFLIKTAEGEIVTVEAGEFDDDGSFAEFAGAGSGLIGEEELAEAAVALNPGTSAAVLVWENRWAAPIATALRRSGAELVATGRIPIQALLASLDATEAAH